VPEDLLIFRVKEYPSDIIVRKELAIAMEEAGFTEVIFKEPKR
jgi:hypothetical protein